MSEPVEFVAEVARVQTLADGGLRVTLDLPEDATMQAAQLMECKRFGAVLDCALWPRSLTDLDDETKKDAEGKAAGVDRRRSRKRRDQLASG